MGRLAVHGAEAAAEVSRRDVRHRSHGAHVQRLGVGAIHRVSGAQQAPVEIFSFAAHPPTLVDVMRSPRAGQETARHRSATMSSRCLRRGARKPLTEPGTQNHRSRNRQRSRAHRHDRGIAVESAFARK
jgi:hypothetical protein